jgi:hypothetical protein
MKWERLENGKGRSPLDTKQNGHAAILLPILYQFYFAVY